MTKDITVNIETLSQLFSPEMMSQLVFAVQLQHIESWELRANVAYFRKTLNGSSWLLKEVYGKEQIVPKRDFLRAWAVDHTRNQALTEEFWAYADRHNGYPWYDTSELRFNPDEFGQYTIEAFVKAKPDRVKIVIAGVMGDLKINTEPFIAERLAEQLLAVEKLLPTNEQIETLQKAVASLEAVNTAVQALEVEPPKEEEKKKK